MIEFITSGSARVTYRRGSQRLVYVTIEGWAFNRQSWDELTAELFPPAPHTYVIDQDVWLP